MDTAAKATTAAMLLSAFALAAALEGVTPAVDPTRASCTEEQVQKCRQSAEDDTLSTLEGGGRCTQQQYVHYTHACTVSNYRPHIDFCCCAASVKVLCCRYQQSWDRFRCSEAEDTIHTLCNKRTEQGESVCAPKRPPLYILLPCVFGPLAIVACCIYCCVRHCRYCHNDDDEEIKWGCSCWSPEKKKHGVGLSDTPGSLQFRNSHSGLSENEPLNSLPVALLVDGSKRPLDSHASTEGARLMPSAPPLDDSADEAFAPGHCLHHPHHLPHHHPHHHRHHPHQPHSLTNPQDPPVSTPSANGFPEQGKDGYSRQASVVSAPPAVYGAGPQDGDTSAKVPCSAGAPSGGGCGYIRQESAPCGPVGPIAPSYTEHVVEGNAEGGATNSATNGHHHFGGVHINVNGVRGPACPSCSTAACAPPTYDESLQHQVLHQ